MKLVVDNDAETNGFRLAQARHDKTLNTILGDLLAEDMVRYDAALKRALEPQLPHLGEAELELYQRGKRLRPVMLLLSARTIHGAAPLPEKVIMAAVSLEMLHVATMIHDDIIDNALVRRGLTSVNARRGTNAAILVGDMQFVQAIRTFVDAIETPAEMELVKLVLDTAFRICVGELDEIETDPNIPLAQARERYFDVIERKTAIMFGLACETGVSLVDGRTSDARRIGFFGRRVGRAFQIFDDLMDFLQPETGSGKRRGMDLAQRCLSLPIIYAMEALGPDHKVSRIVRGQEFSDQDLAQGIAAVVGSDALMRAYSDARLQAIDAQEYLKAFPDNAYSAALRDIAMLTVDRGF